MFVATISRAIENTVDQAAAYRLRRVLGTISVHGAATCPLSWRTAAAKEQMTSHQDTLW